MKEDPHHHHLQYTDMKIILSGITQRCRWKDGANPGKTDKARRFEDSVMATYVHCLSGSFVHHPHIKFDTPAMEFISPPGEMIFFFKNSPTSATVKYSCLTVCSLLKLSLNGFFRPKHSPQCHALCDECYFC